MDLGGEMGRRFAPDFSWSSTRSTTGKKSEMRTFCTIISSNYFPYALTLYKSLIRFHTDEKLMVLVCDEGRIDPDPGDYAGIRIFRANELYSSGRTDLLYHKYGGNPDAFRWSLKPLFIRYLLETGFEKVIYCDCDIFFFNEYNFLFEELNTVSVLLTPGRTTRYPQVHEEEFISLFQYGMFNAGFAGVSKKGIEAMKWWANVCEYKVEINFEKGLFVDQKFLDALPILFDDVSFVKHRGCNIAFWNQHECKRTLVNGQLLINEFYPIIFIHFTNKYIPELLVGNDPLILSYFRKYEKCFEETGYEFGQFINDLPEYQEPSTLLKLKRKLLIRTRIKRWLFRLSEKL